LIVQGLHFYVLVEQLSTQVGASGDVSPVSAFFGNTILLYLVLFLLVPAMTMRLFAEERRSGTAEALLTAPVSTAAVVLSKYVAVLVVYVVMWAPTTLYLVILRRTGALDVHVAASSYLGVLVVGAAYLSTGLLTSAMTKSQHIALVLSALVILVLFLLGVGELVAREGTAMHAICNHVSVWAAMSDFSSGIVDTRRLVFYGTLTVVPLYFTVRVVDAWRWG
jgi:ABC-2 type transport system permease protein